MAKSYLDTDWADNAGDYWEAETVNDHASDHKFIPNGHIPVVELEEDESAEIGVPVLDGETLTVYRWGYFDIDTSDTVTNVSVQLLDDADTVETTETTRDTSSETGVTSLSNTSGGFEAYKLRVLNEDTSAHEVTAYFAYTVN